MRDRAVIVLDVGKTLSKLTLWQAGGRLVERRSRPNNRIQYRPSGGATPYLGLDAAGIESWLEATLRDFGQLAEVGELIPVGHGAAAALIRAGQLLQPPLDYEHLIPEPC